MNSASGLGATKLPTRSLQWSESFVKVLKATVLNIHVHVAVASAKKLAQAPMRNLLLNSAPFYFLFLFFLLHRVGAAMAAAEEQSPDRRISFLTVTTVPEALQGSEKEQSCYPPYLDIDKHKKFPLGPIHSGVNMYRGRDIPQFPLGQDGKGHDASRMRDALLCIRNSEGVVRSSYGHPSYKYEAKDFPNGDPRWIHFMIKPTTQRPCIHIKIAREGRSQGEATQWVTWECNAENIAQREGDIDLLLATGDDPNVKIELPDDGRIQELASKNQLWATSLQLRTDERNCPVWKGITPAEIDKLCADAELKDAGDITHMTDQEACIVALHRTNELSLYVETDDRCQPALEKFFAFARTAFFLTAHLGTFWYYRMACPNTDIHSASYPFSDIPPPRWLVETWRVEYQDGVAVSFEPVRWSKYARVLDGIYGDHDTCAFEIRLGRARESRVNDQDFADLEQPRPLRSSTMSNECYDVMHAAIMTQEPLSWVKKIGEGEGARGGWKVRGDRGIFGSRGGGRRGRGGDRARSGGFGGGSGGGGGGDGEKNDGGEGDRGDRGARGPRGIVGSRGGGRHSRGGGRARGGGFGKVGGRTLS
ncbi:hypothetical protein LTR37_020895 [Vermiconidia calcicola]|uniref:Uncharacterized protein n=1 Tax=Vermiconidia calcicola TaxID=1690605 RepID=A0ACC3MA91_9PEZI|nr:hypothetical protein LTR37_020895 [Vermiconidia calcicola]